MSEEKALLYNKGTVGTLTLNRPQKKNAINGEMIELFNLYLDEIENDDEVRVVLLKANGDKVFCSGADLTGAIGDESNDAVLAYANLLKRLVKFTKPIVARLDGHCLAGGMGLMLSSDIVYAADNIKIGTPEVKVGLFPMMIGALIFKNALRKKAMEMIYTGRLLSAKEAEAMGLITRCYPSFELKSVTDETLETICKNAPLAMKMGREAFSEADEMPFEEGVLHLCGKLKDVIKTDDAAEGLMAFMQKREPEFKGK